MQQPRQVFLFAWVFISAIYLNSSAQGLATLNSGKSTDPVVITDQADEQSLQVILQSLEERYKVHFNYASELVKGKYIRFGWHPRISLESQLDSLLSPLGLKFEKMDQDLYLITREPVRQLNLKKHEKADGRETYNIQTIHRAPLTLPSRQQQTIRGTVTDQESGDPLPGVNILAKGTVNGTVTDISGSYSLTVSDGVATLVFSSIGFTTREIAINGQSEINVALSPDIQSLSEVVVVGYGAVKKKDLTGSVAQVSSEEINAFPVKSVDQALTGRAPGVRVTQNSGRPGSRIQIQIRGGNSMIGNNSPLFVVDGFPITGSINFLNPSDIESMDILKDASATAIYGARGANGVVIITTKRGKAGQQSNIQLESYYGMQETIGRNDVLDASQYAVVVNEWLKNSGQEPFFDENNIEPGGTDWQDAIFRVAPLQNHTLTFSGSSDKTRYALSGNYYNQDGIILNSGAKRGTFRINLDHEMTDWFEIGVNLNLSRRETFGVPVDNGNLGNTVLSGAISAPPTLPLYREDGLPTQIGQVYSFGSATMVNPLIYDSPYKDRDLANSVLGNTNLKFTLAKGLSFTSRLGLEYETLNSSYFSPIIYNNDRGGAAEGTSTRNSFLNENILSFSKELAEGHALNLIAGFTYQTETTSNFNISVSGFSTNTTQNYDLSAAETVNPPTSGFSEWTLVSWLGRANYTLMDKYLFTASLRADGSSRFGEENKWGAFPSAAFAWRVSDEGFLRSSNFVDELKIRTSYGITGNTALSPYQSLDRIGAVKYIYGNQTFETGYVPSGISNSALKWETTSQFDIGFDLNVIKSKLRFTFDYYYKNTSDLLASVPLPRSTGFSSVLQNVGEIENKGFEVSIGANLLNKAFKWDMTGQVSTNRNKIISLAGNNDIYGDQLNLFRSSLNIARVGEPFGSLYGLIETGLDENGYITYQDMNDDGVINTLDRVIIGNPYPDLLFGLNNYFSYGNFELSVFLQGVSGNDLFWATGGTNLNSFQRGTNQFVDIIGNYWTEENPNPNAKYPKISSTTLIDVSDRFIQDGSYLRLKSVRLAYNISEDLLGVNWFRGAQVYLSGTNLFTITNYPGVDPDVNTTGSDSQSVGNRLRVGIDQSAYPSAKMYAAGLKINF